ncbi:MAG: response regulator [Pseudomonadota bacterium]
MSYSQSIPSFYFPTQVMLIDDDPEYCRYMASNLSAGHVTNFVSSVHAPDGLDVLNACQEADELVAKFVSEADESEWEHRAVDINIYDQYREIYNASRFNRFSVVVVDYEMPSMSGFEVCQQIESPYIQKIVLTGEADEGLAIRAFNEGLIDHFIHKQSSNLLEELEFAIQSAQHKYFCKLTETITNAVTKHTHPVSAIAVPDFRDHFFRLTQQHNIVEYYLFESMGSFLMMDADGNHYGLFTSAPEQFEMVIDQAKLEDAPQNIIKDLRDFKRMLCFHHQEDIKLPQVSEWEKYLRPTQMIQGSTPYYFAFDRGLIDLDYSRVIPFAKLCDYQKSEVRNQRSEIRGQRSEDTMISGLS